MHKKPQVYLDVRDVAKKWKNVYNIIISPFCGFNKSLRPITQRHACVHRGIVKMTKWRNETKGNPGRARNNKITGRSVQNKNGEKIKTHAGEKFAQKILTALRKGGRKK